MVIALNVEAIIFAHGVVPGQAGEAGAGQVNIGIQIQIDSTAGNVAINGQHSHGAEL